MNKKIEMTVIGTVSHNKGYTVQLEKEFRAGLTGLAEFTHAVILWVFDKAAWDPRALVMPPAYRKLDHDIGTFATRSPFRPSPVAVSTARILSADPETGIVTLDWIDADEGTPVIDIKPYHPSEDMIRDIEMPAWCAHWPRCREDSGEFDWEAEFTFG